jgi:RHS repeat-associated protein
MVSAAINQYNAGQELFHMDLNDAVVYVNPYFTISTKNYTCHIFNGSQRIATEIGTKNLSTCIDTTEIGRERLSNVRAYMQSLFSTKIELNPDTGSTFMDIEGGVYDELQWYCMNDSVQWEVLLHCDSNMIYSLLLREDGAVDKRVGGSYFYHSDHLGGANWITDSVGRPVQFIHYMPFGEMWYNQQGSAYNERFKFTGKERDDETGYDFFGARYYASSLPLWLSVDPLADKYPYISPYAYCSWDPINKIDPDGRAEWSLDVKTGAFQKNGNKGGSTTDYYSVGTYEGEKFSSYSNYEIERGDGTINSFRIQETDKSTISAFHIPETNTSGFILERPGPDTSDSEQSLRIPANQYGLHENQGSHYPGVPRLYLPNEGIGGKFDTRGILIHVGNYPDDSKGCLLPGSSRTIDFVGNSKITLPKITNYVASKNWLVKLNIFNAFK